MTITTETENRVTTSPPDEPQPTGSMRRVMTLRDFRLLLAGASTSLLGDQFALIATPWLVLQLSNDPLALGIVLALEGLPRAGFMLVGGAVTDRFAPRRVMVVADITRGLLTAAMAVVVLTGVVQMWMLYGFALAFGLVAGFAIPAENSIVPTLVKRDDLQAGNALLMGATQLTGFVGPTVAGAVIAGYSTSMVGIGLAFVIDTASFAISAAAFSLIRRSPRPPADASAIGLWSSIGDGIGHVWADEALRFVFSVLVAVNLFVVGPLLVGIPLLAHQRLPQGAMAFGTLMGAFAIGNLAGYLVAGGAPQPSSSTLRAIVLGVLAGFGAATASLGLATHLWLDAAVLAGLGVGNGYLAISLFTWIQARTPQDMLGRTMSLVTFASLGLVSISQAAAGALARWDLDALFLLSGGLVLAITFWSATRPGLRAFTNSLTTADSPRNTADSPHNTADSSHNTADSSYNTADSPSQPLA
ncbi:MAG: MFS transporter [Acidimicrobiales bacterium]